MNMNAHYQMTQWLQKAIAAEQAGDHERAAHYFEEALRWELRIK